MFQVNQICVPDEDYPVKYSIMLHHCYVSTASSTLQLLSKTCKTNCGWSVQIGIRRHPCRECLVYGYHLAAVGVRIVIINYLAIQIYGLPTRQGRIALRC